jgi:predicted glycoside hydrolase/deacetylase ChbG (UPF0249 family)
MLIINADDWGRDQENTDRILSCFQRNSISSVSAMVFMEDSERGASLARESGVDAGLHLNFTTPFSARNCPAKLAEQQRLLTSYLRRHRLAQVLFHPGLTGAFEYVTTAQLEEYRRLYGAEPRRVDGHHHMHLCANVLAQGLLPRGILVRRNFSFQAGEKSVVNRFYRQALDRRLARKYRLVDYLFSLAPLQPRERLDRVLSLARRGVVEMETHPIQDDEYAFLTEGECCRWAGDVPIARGFDALHGVNRPQ